MASTNFVNGVTLTDDDWFNDVDTVVYGTLSSVTGTNTVTASGPQGLSAYALGQIFRFIPAADNTGAVTLNISSLGAKNVYMGGAACVGGELQSGVPCMVMYDGTQFNLIGGFQGGKVNGNIGIGVASLTTSGLNIEVSGAGNTSIRAQNADNGTASWLCLNADTSGDNKFIAFYTEGTPALRGLIDYNRAGGATRYNTASDGRLKIKNGPAQYDPQWIHNVASSIFDVTWKETGYRVDTFVAQDLYQAEPDAVKKGDDDPVTVTDAWAVDASKLVAKLILEVENLRNEFNAYKQSHP